ncbi:MULTISPECIES: lateral flagellin LafA [unclassified Pseudomonas]|jgi:flagellin|uniref:lateral flagellin LafA n=1 Tax=unclassified Pseudomonas TaxID=196821 RepID=UPI00051DF019|nr:lateral flagellin LafA [Pseudomonas sp.]KGK81811.1 Lateral flagellin [Stutzerimonas degradans]MDT3711920.1 lateral flagellin LafA [Pseudomonadaceae bacterium]MCQ4269249.1 lateral flagellin LafA [Stutzerimonas degradans]OOE11281.1 Lateral flagellin [Stutzerimonas degradans]QCT98376.1 Lateral flagellin [Stutzerimonas degradans]
MALSIHTNYSSLVTQTNLTKSNNALGTNQQRLGTGLRINSAADDAAGLQIATRLNSQSRGMGVAMRNTNDAVSMLQTAEGAFSEMTDILQRMKDLSTQAANATNSGADLIALQAEYDELGKEVANIVQNTKFAGSNLFSNGTTTDGSAGKFSAAMTFQIGASTAEKLTLDVSGKLTALATALGNASDTYTTPATPGVELASTQVATTAVNTNASANITVVETALNAVGELRALFGANINRLNHTNNNLANMKDNTEMAKGRIMDADFASESANMTKNSMLMQSGISMLKQAGQMPGMVMGLLG